MAGLPSTYMSDTDIYIHTQRNIPIYASDTRPSRHSLRDQWSGIWRGYEVGPFSCMEPRACSCSHPTSTREMRAAVWASPGGSHWNYSRSSSTCRCWGREGVVDVCWSGSQMSTAASSDWPQLVKVQMTVPSRPSSGQDEQHGNHDREGIRRGGSISCLVRLLTACRSPRWVRMWVWG